MIHLHQVVKGFTVTDGLAKIQVSQLVVWQDLDNIADAVVAQMEGAAGFMVQDLHGIASLFTKVIPVSIACMGSGKGIFCPSQSRMYG